MSSGGILSAVKRFLGFARSDPHITTLPPKVHDGLVRYLEDGEEVLSVLRTTRSIYKAPSWSDSNQYFSTWLVVTTARVLALRKAPSLTVFRDVPLGMIERVLMGWEESETSITVEMRDRKDIHQFGLPSIPHSQGAKDAIDRAMAAHAVGSPGFCTACGTAIPSGAAFCPGCGAGVR